MIRFTSFFVAAFAWVQPAFGQQVLLLEQGLKVTATTAKTSSSKKRDTWTITVTTETNSNDLYFLASKSGNPLTDLSLSRYVAIHVANSVGIFGSKTKYLTAVKTHLIPVDNSTLYIVPPEVTDSFTVEVSIGSTPDLTANLMVSLKTKAQVDFVRASDPEIFAGATPGRIRFLYLRPLDSLLIRRDQMLQCQSQDGEKSAAIVAEDKFLFVKGRSEGSTTDQVSVAGWDGSLSFVRINEGRLFVSRNASSAESQRISELSIRDEDDKNVCVRVEPVAKNTLAFNRATDVAHLPVSSNGKFALRVEGSALVLVSLTEQASPKWSSVAIGNPSGFTVIVENGKVTVRLTAMPDQTGTGEQSAKFLTVSDDGRLVLFRVDGLAVWRS